MQRTLCSRLGIGAVRHRAQYDHEFIAAQTCHGIDTAYPVDQAPRHLLQQRVTGAVSHGVVNDLEAIQIAHQQSEHLLVAVGVRDRLLHPILQQHAVRQTGQHIVSGQIAQLPIGRLQPLVTLLER